MKRVYLINEQLCNIVKNCEVNEYEQFLYDLRNTEAFSDYIIDILESFDTECFKNMSEQEMSEITNNGEYSKKFIEWLNENV